MVRAPLALALVVTALGLAASQALASVADEQRAGQALAQQVQSGTRSCNSLSADDLDQIGESVMGQMVGSTSVHEALNARMTAVMGSQAESRMHQVLGARFVGCTSSGGGPSGSMMGGQGMMGSAGDWSWMTGSRWRHMSVADWQALQRRVLGTAARGSHDSGWQTRDVVLLALAAALAAGMIALLLARRARQRTRT